MAGRSQWEAKINSNASVIKSDVENLKKTLERLSDEKYSIKIDADISKLESIISTLDSVFGKNGNLSLFNSKELQSLNGQLNTIVKSLGDVRTSSNAIQAAFRNGLKIDGTLADIKKLSSDIDGLQTNVNKAVNSNLSSSLERDVTKYERIYKQLSSKPPGIDQSDAYKASLNDLEVKLKNLGNLKERVSKSTSPASEQDIELQKKLTNEINETVTALRSMGAAQKGSNSLSRNKLADSISEYINKNSAMSANFKKELLGLQRQLSMLGANADVSKLRDEFLQLKIQIREAGQEGKRFGDVIKDKAWYGLAGTIGTYFGLNEVIEGFKYGINTVRELDTALTEMRKVSDETVASLERYQKTTFDTADAVGATAAKIQNSTADWLRLGESMEDAAESARVSNILLNVSEFESIDAATESLVSMSQAYDDLDKIDIVDKLNQVGNSFSISTDGLSQGLQKAASALKTSGNDINEAIALITAGNAIVQDPLSVGAGIRTISLRLTGTKAGKEQLEEMGEDTEGYIETVSKLRETIMAATKAANGGQGFDILDENGNYKSTFEIMLGLAKLYDNIAAKDKELGTTNLQLLLETVAGKNRANIASSILQSPELLESVFNEAAYNSEGSAQKELDAHLESINGRVEKLINRAQEFWSTLIDSDTIKNGVDLITELVQGATTFIDVLGPAPLLIGGITAALGKGSLEQQSCPVWWRLHIAIQVK